MSLWNAVKQVFSVRDARLIELLDALPLFVEESVTEASALSLANIMGAIKLKCDVIGSLPIFVYRKTTNGKERVDNRLARILHEQPNQWMTASEWKEAMVYSLAMRGASYHNIARGLDGEVKALMPLTFERMAFKFDELEGPSYRYSYQDRPAEQLDPNNVLHIHGFGASGFQGVDPLKASARNIANALAAERFAAVFFRNGGKISNVIETDRILTKDQREKLSDVIKQWTSGDRAHSDLILEAGFKHKQAGADPEKSQLLETRKHNQNMLLKSTSVTPDMVGELDRATFASMEELGIRFVEYTLRPDIVRIEQAMNRALIPLKQRRELSIEFNLDALMRGNSQSRAKFYSAMVQNGIMTRNEARAKENLPLMDGADDLTYQLNLQDVDDDGREDPPIAA